MLRVNLMPPPVPGFIYFIGLEVLTDGPIKIGWAIEPIRRLAMLQTGNPRRLVVHALTRGAVNEEHDLHRHFAAARRRGEWFGLTSELCELLEMLGAPLRVEYPAGDGTFGSHKSALRQLFPALIDGAVPMLSRVEHGRRASRRL